MRPATERSTHIQGHRGFLVFGEGRREGGLWCVTVSSALAVIPSRIFLGELVRMTVKKVIVGLNILKQHVGENAEEK